MKNKRLLTALAALPILIASILLPYFFPHEHWLKYVFVMIAALALGAGLFEFYSLTKKLELKADASIGYVCSMLLLLAFSFDAPTESPEFLFITIVISLIAVLISQTFRFQKDFTKILTGIGVTLLGVFYVVFLGGFLVALRVGFNDTLIPFLSTKLLGFFFLILMGADTGAYYIGKTFGKHKLVPQISPGKTWEGLVGGVVVSIAFAALASLTFFPELPFKASIPLAIFMSLVGVAGDLAESAMKRGAGAKDAATILPGHGGLLDRLDSLLFNAPILYYFARFFFVGN